jgi:hypothetical protein
MFKRSIASVQSLIDVLNANDFFGKDKSKKGKK